MRKRIGSLLMAVLLLWSIHGTAFAQDAPQGSISITMRRDGTPIPGGTLTLYRVGDSGLQPIGDFASYGKSLADAQSPELAADLAAYAKKHHCEGLTKEIGNDGNVIFSDLELGLYLLVQHTAADGYYKALPFLVAVPKLEQGAYTYQITARPKIEPVPKPSTPPAPRPQSPTLPQTGQLNWPVPLLAVLGVGLFTAGWLGRKKNGYEE